MNGFLSMLHHALRATRRRYVIELLASTDEPVLSVRDLAREVAAREHALPVDRATGEPYRNAYNALSQTHLPTLARGSILIYDPNRQTVSRGANFTLAALLVAINRPAVQTLSSPESDDEDDLDDQSSITD